MMLHCFLIITQQTSYERIKKAWKDIPMNPFSRKLSYMLTNIASWFKYIKYTRFDKHISVSLEFNHCNINPSRRGFRSFIADNVEYHEKTEKNLVD